MRPHDSSPDAPSIWRRPVPRAVYGILAFVMASLQIARFLHRDGLFSLWYLVVACFYAGAGVYLIVQGRR